jgi:hypothetical protein
MASYKVTNELMLNERIVYLLRINKEEMMIVLTEPDAKLAIDSLAVSEENRLKKVYPNRRVFREEDERCIKVFTQTRGAIYDGSPNMKSEIDYIPIGCGVVVGNRFPIARIPDILNEINYDIPPAPEAPGMWSRTELIQYAKQHKLEMPVNYHGPESRPF